MGIVIFIYKFDICSEKLIKLTTVLGDFEQIRF